MKDIDWSKAPEGYPIWIEDLNPHLMPDGSGWHKDDGDRYVDIHGKFWDKPERNDFRAHRRPATPQWDGEGEPPIGAMVCVVDDGTLRYGVDEEGPVVAHVENCAVVRMSYGLGCFRASVLRPVLTPEQIAADERRAAIDMMVDRFALFAHPDILWRDLFAQMYDCGCRMIAEEDK